MPFAYALATAGGRAGEEGHTSPNRTKLVVSSSACVEPSETNHAVVVNQQVPANGP